MKKTIVLSFVIAILSISCGNTDAGQTTNTSGNTGSNSPGSAGKGYMTATIDGTPVSISVQNSFFPITLSPDSKGPTDGLELLDGSAKKQGFQFEIKDHGTTNIKPGADNILCIFTYFDKMGATYVGKDVTVTITSVNANHLSGTFSGKFEKEIGHNIFITIADGKFDLQR